MPINRLRAIQFQQYNRNILKDADKKQYSRKTHSISLILLSHKFYLGPHYKQIILFLKEVGVPVLLPKGDYESFLCRSPIVCYDF